MRIMTPAVRSSLFLIVFHFISAIDEDEGDLNSNDAIKQNDANLNANNGAIRANDARRSSELAIEPLVMKNALFESPSKVLAESLSLVEAVRAEPVRVEPVHPVEVHGDSSATAFWTEDELAELADRLSIESRLRKADEKLRSHLEVRFDERHFISPAEAGALTRDVQGVHGSPWRRTVNCVGL